MVPERRGVAVRQARPRRPPADQARWCNSPFTNGRSSLPSVVPKREFEVIMKSFLLRAHLAMGAALAAPSLAAAEPSPVQVVASPATTARGVPLHAVDLDDPPEPPLSPRELLRSLWR